MLLEEHASAHQTDIVSRRYFGAMLKNFISDCIYTSDFFEVSYFPFQEELERDIERLEQQFDTAQNNNQNLMEDVCVDHDEHLEVISNDSLHGHTYLPITPSQTVHINTSQPSLEITSNHAPTSQNSQ